MRILYANDKLERACNDQKYCKRHHGILAEGIARRHNALKVATSIEDLKRIDPLGNWHGLKGDRAGQLAGCLNRNYRLIIKPGCDGLEIVAMEETVTVLSIEDYH